ncbi:hypothetical protein QLS71_003575 [Mariniflexile litorale]|uniref:Uncharacterized protein n=1 Tax=Mariniflexile litorale TaxID=3045158 RepID=A0AAU7EHI1_9FLAO|nr:hypothetical protein [Mariniflexile sp. KMM 9835]MDQ8210099.1 hypothetical protein [Mariniflexile sp. KMM 9835]
MKIKMRTLLLIPFFALLLFTSCQEEVIEVTPPDESETLSANSQLTALISATSKKDGSKDNIIDNASCLTVELPVTVIVNNLEIIVDSEEDYKTIETIFKEFDNDDDKLEIIFPAKIILSDYTEIVINNKEEFIEFAIDCKEENALDDDIECIDFAFPISFSVYNTEFQIIDVVTIENDKQLYLFINRVKQGEVFASLNFPLTMKLADGSEIVVNNNIELEQTINEAKDACDEDDDNNYGDDDFTKEKIEDYLQQCYWRISRLSVDNLDNEKDYIGRPLKFYANNIVKLRVNGELVEGTYQISEKNIGFLLEISLDNRPNLKLEWIITFLEPNLIKLKNANNQMILKSHCPDGDEDINEINDYLTSAWGGVWDGGWKVTSYIYEDDDQTVHFEEYPIKFIENGYMDAISPEAGPDYFVPGSWLAYRSEEKLFLDIQFIVSDLFSPFFLLNGRWEIKEATATRIELKDYSTTGAIKRILILEFNND